MNKKWVVLNNISMLPQIEMARSKILKNKIHKNL